MSGVLHVMMRTLLRWVLLLAVFFTSGVSALVYQVVWTRQLALVFGVTIHAVSVVLAVFMGGLALGYYLGGKFAGRVRRPLLAYAGLEAGIAVLALVVLLAVQLLGPVYVGAFALFGGSAFAATLLRFVVAALALLLPTCAMGATLPFITQALSHRHGGVGGSLSLLYAVNTAGAAAGALLAGFYLIGNLGFQTSIFIAAALNLGAAGLAGLLSLLLDGSSAADDTANDSAPEPQAAEGNTRLVVLAMAVSGLCALAYEVVWFRVMDLFLDGTSYAFSLMLAVFLVGLALGSAACRLILQARWNWLAVLGLVELGIALSALAGPYLLSLLPDSYAAMQASLPWLQAHPDTSTALLLALALAPLTLLLGVSFPVATQAITQGSREPMTLLGWMSAANTTGALAGSLLAGFVLMPLLGSQHSLVLLAAANAAAAVALLWPALRTSPRRLALAAAPALVVLLPLGAPDMLRTVYKYAPTFKDHQLVWMEEGLETTVSVHKWQSYLLLYSNSRGQASDSAAGNSFHKFLGLLPMVLHGQAHDALVVGLGGGTTGGAVAAYPNVQVDVIELSPSMVTGATYFADHNFHITERPNVHIKLDDGRNHLLVTPKKYDVATADIIQPDHVGAGNLYSKEYFTLLRKGLAPGGMVAQWAERGKPKLYPYIVRTFLDAFPHVSFWCSGRIMLGSNEAVELNREQLARNLANPEVAKLFADLGILTVDDLLAHYTGDDSVFRQALGTAPVVSDDRPVTEYFRVLPDGEEPGLAKLPADGKSCPLLTRAG